MPELEAGGGVTLARSGDILTISIAGGAVTPQQFGAIGDGVTNDGAAFVAAIAALKAAAVNDSGFNKGSPKLFIPAAKYYLGSTTLDITHTLIIEGEGFGVSGGSPTELHWAAGATGFRIQRSNTTGATGVQTETIHVTFGGDGTEIRNLACYGGWNGSNEGEFYGIHLRARATIENVHIDGFQGDGIRIFGTAGGGAGLEGNANGFRISNARIQTCRNGVFVDGSDVNAGVGESIDVAQCRQWGIFDSSFLGNTWIACEAAACGIPNGTYTPCEVSQGGNRYVCVLGQETGASTNAPTGAATDNQWWLFVESGGPDTTSFNIPAWLSGTTYRAGGCYGCDNANATSTFFGCYNEGGQGWPQSAQLGLFVGGALGRVPAAAWIYASAGRAASRGYHRIESRVLNSTDFHELGAGDDANLHLRKLQSALITPWTWYERWDSSGNLGLSNLDGFGAGDNPYLISHPTSTATWGPGRVNFAFGYGLGGLKVRSGTAAPTSGAWLLGDRVWNSAPAVGQPKSWVCTAAGTPGTWVSEGNL